MPRGGYAGLDVRAMRAASDKAARRDHSYAGGGGGGGAKGAA